MLVLEKKQLNTLTIKRSMIINFNDKLVNNKTKVDNDVILF